MAVVLGARGTALVARPSPALRHPRPHASLVAATKRARLVVVAAAADDDTSPPPPPPPPPPTTPGAAAAQRAQREADELLLSLPDLTLPSTRHQPNPLPRERLRALRAESEELAKRKALARVQVGAKGLTASFVAAAALALSGAPGGLLRVKLGEGCGLERRSAAAAMERLLDAVCVKQVGFCVTLFREKGLPRQDNLVASDVGGGDGGGGETARRPATMTKAAKREGQGREKSRTSSSSNSSPPPSPKPPAFTVV
jgi:RNA-binding protein YhbY